MTPEEAVAAAVEDSRRSLRRLAELVRAAERRKHVPFDQGSPWPTMVALADALRGVVREFEDLA